MRELLARDGPMTEGTARKYYRQLISGLAHCHHHGVCHRDLKLENLLLGGEDGRTVKLADFGFAKSTEWHGQQTTVLGTVSYIPPEMLRETQSLEVYDGFKADVWSSGVILFALITGELPFGVATNLWMQNEVFRRIKEREVVATVDVQARFSTDLSQLWDRLCCLDPLQRPDVSTLQRCMTQRLDIGNGIVAELEPEPGVVMDQQQSPNDQPTTNAGVVLDTHGNPYSEAETRGLGWLQGGESYVSPELRQNDIRLHVHDDDDDKQEDGHAGGEPADMKFNPSSPWQRLYYESREYFQNMDTDECTLKKPPEGVSCENQQKKGHFDKGYVSAGGAVDDDY